MSVTFTSQTNRIALYDTVSGWAFGPTFKDEDEAEAFLTYLEENDYPDPRKVTDPDMELALADFRHRQDAA